MTDLLSFNDPSKTDISIKFSTGHVLRLDSTIIRKTFEYFEAGSSINDINKSKPMVASSIFHDEEILAEALVRAHFGKRVELQITPENWMAHLHLCHVLSATKEHYNYVIRWLQTLDITKLDVALQDYMSHHYVSGEVFEKVMIFYHYLKCVNCGVEIVNDKCPNGHSPPSQSQSPPSRRQHYPYSLAPILIWCGTAHNHVAVDIVGLRTMITTYHIGSVSLPPNAAKLSFLLH